MVELRNASDLPVTNVKLEVALRTADDDEAEPDSFGKHSTEPVVRPGGGIQVIRVEGKQPVGRADLRGLHTTPMNRVVIKLRFTDAAGTTWLRTSPPGTLESVDT